jgi:lipoate-protein ligase A
MAVDQAIMEAVGVRSVPPTLRFYAWEPACLSLGYAQLSSEVDVDRLQAHGWDLVRRATGGKAILHTDELTYSVAFHQDDPMVADGILSSYRRLSVALLAGLAKLGVKAESTPLHETANPAGPVCFEVPSNYEITVQNRKLIGSAQVRRAEAVLQHGSAPLTGDVARICEALVFDNEDERERARARVRRRAITVEQARGAVVSWQAAAKAFAEAFAETFDAWLEPGELTPHETARHDQLLVETYASDAWTFRR